MNVVHLLFTFSVFNCENLMNIKKKKKKEEETTIDFYVFSANVDSFNISFFFVKRIVETGRKVYF